MTIQTQDQRGLLEGAQAEALASPSIVATHPYGPAQSRKNLDWSKGKVKSQIRMT